jgi:predicted amidohydrolase
VGNIGVIICFDMGFPEVGRVLALNGAEIVFVPSAWRLEDLDLWTHNLSGQATANLLYMVGANRVGRETSTCSGEARSWRHAGTPWSRRRTMKKRSSCKR